MNDLANQKIIKIAIPMIWLALVIYSIPMIKELRRSR